MGWVPGDTTCRGVTAEASKGCQGESKWVFCDLLPAHSRESSDEWLF